MKIGLILSVIGIIIFISAIVIAGLLSEQYWIIPVLLAVLGIAVYFIYKEIKRWWYF